jgi:hypothetical protein
VVCPHDVWNVVRNLARSDPCLELSGDNDRSRIGGDDPRQGRVAPIDVLADGEPASAASRRRRGIVGMSGLKGERRMVDQAGIEPATS